MVVLPAAEGDMGVLPGHAPMIVLLRGGTISLYENGSVTDRLYVAGGFVEVTTERCTVLATEVLPVGEVSRAVGEKRLADAEAAYASADKNDVVTLDMVMDRIQSARAMIEAAGAA
jgi:F-type H+-transporting ATPase subunit epsilon